MKVFSFEVKKLYNNKTLIVSIISLIILLNIFFIIGFINKESIPDSLFNRENELIYYTEQIDKIKFDLESGNYDNLEEKKYLIKEKELLTFLVGNQKVKADFLYMDNLMQKSKPLIFSSFMFNMFNSVYILVLVITIFLVIYTFSLDFSNNRYKNYLLGSQREDIYKGKIKFQTVLSLIISIVHIIPLILLGLFNAKTNILFYNNGAYKSINSILSIFLQFLGLIFFQVIIISTLNFIQIIIRDFAITIYTIGVFLFVLLTSFILFNKYIEINPGFMENPDELFPFFNINLIFKTLSLRTLFYGVAYLIIIIFLSLYNKRKFSKLDF